MAFAVVVAGSCALTCDAGTLLVVVVVNAVVVDVFTSVAFGFVVLSSLWLAFDVVVVVEEAFSFVGLIVVSSASLGATVSRGFVLIKIGGSVVTGGGGPKGKGKCGQMSS